MRDTGKHSRIKNVGALPTKDEEERINLTLDMLQDLTYVEYKYFLRKLSQRFSTESSPDKE